MNQFATEFDQFCIARHQMGAEQYGPIAFLNNNMVQFIAEELADLCNYAKYMYIKLRLFEDMYASSTDSSVPVPHIGVEDFFSSRARTAPDAQGLRDLLRRSEGVSNPGQRSS